MYTFLVRFSPPHILRERNSPRSNATRELPLPPLLYINKNREDNSFAGQQRPQKSGQQLCVEDGDATELLRAKNDGTINSPWREHGGTSYGNDAGSSTHDSPRRKYRWGLEAIEKRANRWWSRCLDAYRAVTGSQKNRVLIIEWANGTFTVIRRIFFCVLPIRAGLNSKCRSVKYRAGKSVLTLFRKKMKLIFPRIVLLRFMIIYKILFVKLYFFHICIYINYLKTIFVIP